MIFHYLATQLKKSVVALIGAVKRGLNGDPMHLSRSGKTGSGPKRPAEAFGLGDFFFKVIFS